ncbi:phosphotransferase family protein [Trebonia sp.]|uniref:phosphotransferase family protein n=1 Tax=Trebonia sp. TaxID=2767075 RepID=UPI0026343BB9|nr:phosphotransferase family protein [Trebonia sp.]
MTSPRLTPAIDVDRLAEWMDSVGIIESGPLHVRYIAVGTQNEIFEVRRGERHMVLRKPPPNAAPGRDKGILREWQVLAALKGTDVPHADPVALCADASVLGRPFYLMGFVDGWSPMSAAGTRGVVEPFLSDPSLRPGLARELVRGAALLAGVDWRAAGLTGFGRPEGFHDRQVDRWLEFHRNARGRVVPGMDVATKWLRRHRPIDFVPGIMHGDYQFGNVMFAHGAPGRLAAIVDWEMATIGDPKLDLAACLRDWPDRGVPTAGIASTVDIAGMPPRDELTAHYAEVSGRQVDDFDYYLVLARWKLAIVLEQGYQKAGEDQVLQGFAAIVEDLMRQAADLAESTPYAVGGA